MEIAINKSVPRTAELVSTKVIIESLPADTLWQRLDKQCVVCLDYFRTGDSITSIFYIPEGEEKRSGACHTKCLEDQGV